MTGLPPKIYALQYGILQDRSQTLVRRCYPGQAIKETKIGYLFSSKVHVDGLPLDQDPEQDCDRSALGSIVDLEINGRFDSQSGFFSYLSFKGTLQRFVPSYFASRQRPKSQAGGLADKEERALVILNPGHHGDLLLWVKPYALLFRHPS